MKHWGKASVGIAVTVFLLWWVLRDVPFGEVVANIAGGNFLLLFASVAVATFGFVIRALRWRVLLTPVCPNTRFRSRFAALSIGMMGNNLLPARAGEFARALSFSRMEPVSVTAAFGSLVVERFMDGVVLLLFLIVPILTPGFPAADAFTAGYGLALFNFAIALVLGILVVLVVIAALPRQFIAVAERIAVLFPKGVGDRTMAWLHGLLEAISIMRSPRLLLSGFAWSLFFWTWHGTSFWLGMKAFGIDTGWVSAFFTEGVVGFAVALPAAPGFFGTFHAGAAFALTTVYGVPDAQALAFAFAYHFGGWIPITSIGLWYTWKLGMSLGDVGRSGDEKPESSEREDPHSTSDDRGTDEAPGAASPG